jgi:hypothetical protein
MPVIAMIGLCAGNETLKYHLFSFPACALSDGTLRQTVNSINRVA